LNYGINRRAAIWVAALAFCLAGVLMLRLGYHPALHGRCNAGRVRGRRAAVDQRCRVGESLIGDFIVLVKAR
jgi:hypothetical protein